MVQSAKSVDKVGCKLQYRELRKICAFCKHLNRPA